MATLRKTDSNLYMIGFQKISNLSVKLTDRNQGSMATFVSHVG